MRNSLELHFVIAVA